VLAGGACFLPIDRLRMGRSRATGKASRSLFIVAGVIIVIAIIAGVAIFTTRNAITAISGTTSVITTSTDPRLAFLTLNSSNPVLGSNNAPVTIFQFGDFQCTTCDYWFKTQESQVIHNLINSSEAKLVWRDFDYYGPDSTFASEAAYAAGEQGKFWQFYDTLYSNQQEANNGWASKTNLIGFAKSIGLNMAEFNQSFTSGKFDSLISANYKAGQSLGITGTPTFFLVGPKQQIVQIVGAQPASVFEQAVNSMIPSR